MKIIYQPDPIPEFGPPSEPASSYRLGTIVEDDRGARWEVVFVYGAYSWIRSFYGLEEVAPE